MKPGPEDGKTVVPKPDCRAARTSVHTADVSESIGSFSSRIVSVWETLELLATDCELDDIPQRAGNGSGRVPELSI